MLKQIKELQKNDPDKLLIYGMASFVIILMLILSSIFVFA